MGADKALLRFGSSTLIERAIATVQQVAEDVMIVGERPEYYAFGVPVVADKFVGGGPLGGIGTALIAARHERVLVVACDMPYLSARVLAAMADEPPDYDALVPWVSADGGPETMHAIYTRRCLPAIERQIAAGALRVADLLALVHTRYLDERWLRARDPDVRSLTNVNTRDELAAAHVAGAAQ